MVSCTGSIPTALRICLANPSNYSWHLSLICATISISCEGSVTLPDRLTLLWMPEPSCSAAVPSKMQNQTHDISTSAATTANLLSCTWYSDLSLAAGDHSSKVRFATSQQHWAHTVVLGRHPLPLQGSIVTHFMVKTVLYSTVPEYSIGTGISVYPFLDSYPHVFFTFLTLLGPESQA